MRITRLLLYVPNELPRFFLLIAGLILMFANLFRGLMKGEEAGDNPWAAATLEWQIPSPPPTENFDKIPVVNRGPLDFREFKRND